MSSETLGSEQVWNSSSPGLHGALAAQRPPRMPRNTASSLRRCRRCPAPARQGLSQARSRRCWRCGRWVPAGSSARRQLHRSTALSAGRQMSSSPALRRGRVDRRAACRRRCVGRRLQRRQLGFELQQPRHRRLHLLAAVGQALLLLQAPATARGGRERRTSAIAAMQQQAQAPLRTPASANRGIPANRSTPGAVAAQPQAPRTARARPALPL